ncbi:MAG: HAD family hydrolase [Steroidobacteraceae bacterium]
MNASPVFLDRDGTLVVEKHYLSDPAEVSLEEGVVAALRVLRSHAHPLVVLSNQSGIGRGLFPASAAHAVNARIDDLLRAGGVDILGWYICPHAPAAGCDCRKPSPGLALRAAREHGLRLAGSFVIGDKQADVLLADAIGATGILVTTGQGAEAAEWAKSHAAPVFDSLGAAAAFVTEMGS